MKSPDKSIIWGVILLIMWNLKLDPGYTTVSVHGSGYFPGSFTLTMPFFLFPQNGCQIFHHFFRDYLFYDSSFPLIFVYYSYDCLIWKIVSNLFQNRWGNHTKGITNVARSGCMIFWKFKISLFPCKGSLYLRFFLIPSFLPRHDIIFKIFIGSKYCSCTCSIEPSHWSHSLQCRASLRV